MKINSVELEIGGQKITLTLKQVAELKKILAEAFPEPTQIPIYIPGPVVEKPVYPLSPYIGDNPIWGGWEVTCQNDQLRLHFTNENPA